MDAERPQGWWLSATAWQATARPAVVGASATSSALAGPGHAERFGLTVSHQRAAGMEAAAGRDAGRVRRLADQDLLLHLAAPRAPPTAAHACRGAGATRRIVGGRTDLDDAAEVHHRDAVGDVPGQPEVVGDDEDRHVLVAHEVEQEAEDLAPHGGVEARHRLVGHQQLGSTCTIAPAMTTRWR